MGYRPVDFGYRGGYVNIVSGVASTDGDVAAVVYWFIGLEFQFIQTTVCWRLRLILLNKLSAGCRHEAKNVQKKNIQENNSNEMSYTCYTCVI